MKKRKIMKNIKVDEQKLNHQYGYRTIKRIFDFVAALLAVVILSPTFLIIAIAIKINDPHGPVFYTQERVGKDGRRVRMFKFRSMVTHADELRENLN